MTSAPGKLATATAQMTAPEFIASVAALCKPGEALDSLVKAGALIAAEIDRIVAASAIGSEEGAGNGR